VPAFLLVEGREGNGGFCGIGVVVRAMAGVAPGFFIICGVNGFEAAFLATAAIVEVGLTLGLALAVTEAWGSSASSLELFAFVFAFGFVFVSVVFFRAEDDGVLLEILLFVGVFFVVLGVSLVAGVPLACCC